MHVGILGTGGVGQTLAAGFRAKGHEVTIGTRDPVAARSRTESDQYGTPGIGAFLAEHPDIALATFAKAAAAAEVGVLCAHGVHAVAVVQAAGPANLAGKLVMDTTNPLAFGEHGAHKPESVRSSVLEDVQAVAPAAHFVKAWNCVPGRMMVHPQLDGGPGTQFICGDDADSKQKASDILADFGWESIDVGDSTMGPYVEGMAITVINHGARSGNWSWGLKLIHA